MNNHLCHLHLGTTTRRLLRATVANLTAVTTLLCAPALVNLAHAAEWKWSHSCNVTTPAGMTTSDTYCETGNLGSGFGKWQTVTVTTNAQNADSLLPQWVTVKLKAQKSVGGRTAVFWRKDTGVLIFGSQTQTYRHPVLGLGRIEAKVHTNAWPRTRIKTTVNLS